MDCVNTDAAARLALASDCSATADDFRALLLEFPDEVMRNPAFRMMLSADPSFPGTLPPLGLALLGLNSELSAVVTGMRGTPQAVLDLLSVAPAVRSGFASGLPVPAVDAVRLAATSGTAQEVARSLIAVAHITRALGISRFEWAFDSEWEPEEHCDEGDEDPNWEARHLGVSQELSLDSSPVDPANSGGGNLLSALRLLATAVPGVEIDALGRGSFGDRLSWRLTIDLAVGSLSASARPCGHVAEGSIEFQRFDCEGIRAVEELLGPVCPEGVLVALWDEISDDREEPRLYSMSTRHVQWERAVDALFPGHEAEGEDDMHLVHLVHDGEDCLHEDAESVSLPRTSCDRLRVAVIAACRAFQDAALGELLYGEGADVGARVVVALRGRVAKIDSDSTEQVGWLLRPESAFGVQRCERDGGHSRE